MIRENLINNLEELIEEVILNTKGVTVEDPISLNTNIRILFRENDVEHLIDNHLSKDKLYGIQQECIEKFEELSNLYISRLDELEDQIDKLKDTTDIILKTVVFTEDDPLDLLIQEDVDNLCDAYDELRKAIEIDQNNVDKEFDFI